MGAILSYPDRTLAATLSAGSWNASYPLDNLKNTLLSRKARSSNAAAASSKIRLDMGATARAIRVVAVLGHNISFAGTIQARGYSDSGYTTLVSGADSTACYAYPQSLTAEKAADYPNHWIFCFPSDKTARYWEIQITDTANAAGYIELGRLWIGEAVLAPQVGIVYGATLGYESRDVVTESLGGAFWGESKTPRRVATVQFSQLASADKRAALIMQKNLGKLGELLYVMDTEAAAIDIMLESFPATMREVNPILYPYVESFELPVQLLEIIDNGNA